MLLIFIPALYLDLLQRYGGKRTYKRRSETRIGKQWDIEVYRGTTNLAAVAELCTGKVLGHIYHKVDLAFVQQVECLGLLVGVEGQ